MVDTLGMNRVINRSESDPPAVKSKRERRVDSIGVSVYDLDLNFKSVFRNEYKTDKNGKPVYSHGQLVPASNLDKLHVNAVSSEQIDDKTGLVITGSIFNTYKKTTHYPEIALYRTTVKESWNPSMKGKVYCDCEAFRYFLAYPANQTHNLRDGNRDSTLRYTAKTHHDPGPIRIRNPDEVVAMCKHIAKLWRHILANGGLERFAGAI
jgi:hypothetical protein